MRDGWWIEINMSLKMSRCEKNYIFRPCSHEELNRIIKLFAFTDCSWHIISPDYMDGLEIIEDKDNEIIALIYYDPYRNENCEMFIMQFEVRGDLRRKGHGKLIIKQFLREHAISAELLPQSEESVLFWRACGFKGDRYGLYYYPRSLNTRKMKKS